MNTDYIILQSKLFYFDFLTRQDDSFCTQQNCLYNFFYLTARCVPSQLFTIERFFYIIMFQNRKIRYIFSELEFCARGDHSVLRDRWTAFDFDEIAWR